MFHVKRDGWRAEMPQADRDQTQQTPTPWKVFITPDGLRLVGIGAENGEGICDAGFGIWSWDHPDGIANANLIVRAVNSHAQMFAALKALAEEGPNAKWQNAPVELLRAAQAAIAQAEAP
jgi:hypothetical protein